MFTERGRNRAVSINYFKVTSSNPVCVSPQVVYYRTLHYVRFGLNVFAGDWQTVGNSTGTRPAISAGYMRECDRFGWFENNGKKKEKNKNIRRANVPTPRQLYSEGEVRRRPARGRSLVVQHFIDWRLIYDRTSSVPFISSFFPTIELPDNKCDIT